MAPTDKESFCDKYTFRRPIKKLSRQLTRLCARFGKGGDKVIDILGGRHTRGITIPETSGGRHSGQVLGPRGWHAFDISLDHEEMKFCCWKG